VRTLRRHARVVLAALATSIVLSACGAKTGLDRPEFDAGRPDAFAARDAFVPPDAPPECRTDATCDDGLACSDDRCVGGSCQHTYLGDRCNDSIFCNGLEQCVPGVGCVSPGRTCDDGVACTEDFCAPDSDRCSAIPDDAACPLSFRCDLARGCLARALVHDSTTLFEIDLPSGELARLGAFPISLNDIALAPDGTFYGASTDVSALVRVDYRTVSYEIVAPVFGSFNALDVAPDGTLYGAADDIVYAFDVAAGSAREVARFPAGWLSSGDLAFVEGRLYATAYRMLSDLTDQLVQIDLATGRSALIGAIGFDCMWALAPLGTSLYGLTCNGELTQLDLSTGAGTLLASRPGQAYWGAASR
jgi:hypothetical protein